MVNLKSKSMAVVLHGLIQVHMIVKLRPVGVIEKCQGLKIACLEDIAFQKPGLQKK